MLGQLVGAPQSLSPVMRGGIKSLYFVLWQYDKS